MRSTAVVLSDHRQSKSTGREALILIAGPSSAGLKRWRHGLHGMSAIHEVTGRLALEQSVTKLKPAVLLLDLALPKLGGIEGVQAIRRLSPTTKIVLIGTMNSEKEAVSALKSGVDGYCNKDVNPTLLRKAVERVQNDEIWLPRNLIRSLLQKLTSSTTGPEQKESDSEPGDLDCLTDRKREIVHLISRGSTNKEIANRLNVTVATVKAHVTAIFRKLGLSDRVSLAVYVAEHKRLSR